MTIILDPVDDELIDGLTCPRCSTSEPFAEPNMSVEWYGNLSFKCAPGKIPLTRDIVLHAS